MTNTLFLRIGPLLIAGALTGCNKGPTAPSSGVDPPTPARPANPAATYTLAGTISESGTGPLGGVSVITDRGKTAFTDEQGQYRMEGLAGVVNVRFEKLGYESGRSGAILDRDQIVNGVIQRTTQMAPGDRTEITVFRDDPDYDLAYAACSAPCKMIRTAGPGGIVISIRARARDESRSVCLLVDGGPPHFANPTCSAAEVTTTTTLFFGGGEFQFYVKFGDGYREGTQSVEVSVTLGTQP